MTEDTVKTQNKRSKKLVFHIMRIVFAIVVGLCTLQTVIVAMRTRILTASSYEEDCEKITEGYASTVSTRISEYIKQMRMYTASDIVQTNDPKEIQKWLVGHAKSRTPDYDRIGFVDEKGNFYNDQGKVSNVLDRSYYKAIMEKGHDIDIDDPVISKSTGVSIIHVSSAAKLNGKTIGFFSAVVGIDKISDYVSKLGLGSTGAAVLIDSKGEIIASSVVFENDDKKQEMKDFINPVVTASQKNPSGSMWLSNPKQGKFFVSYASIENTEWKFAFMVSEKQVYNTANEIQIILSLAGIIVTIVILSTIGVSILRSLKPLTGVQNAVSGIAEGNADLTRRLSVSGSVANNEIGGVVNGFNRFIEKLHTIVTAVKNSKQTLVSSGNQLYESMESTESSISEILSNIESMGSNISLQSESVQSTAGAVNEIASNIDSLNRMIKVQTDNVTQASSAVEEMISNINTVNSSMEKMAESFSELEHNAVTGTAKQDDVNKRIQQIQRESETLQEANTVISTIASQTNLLAMNAAIEAAHAGEAGKGFSVVADEIRKLSETSSAQSKRIGEQLKIILDSINGMVKASNDSSVAFQSVSEGIVRTNSIVQEVKSAMQEQTVGSKQINEALHSVNDSTSEVRTASQEMSIGNKAILDEIQNLQNATLSMKTCMDEMAAGARKINSTGAALASLASNMNESISEIGNQIDQFKV